jgi:SAM-dependent methyltransferase
MQEVKEAHTSGGLRGILEISFFHNLWQHVSGVERAKRNIVREYVKPFPAARILDIGCGTGVLLDYIKEKVDYVGFDINGDYIEHAKKKYGARGKFYCTSVNDSYVEEKNFDIAIAIGILHHLDDSESEKLISSAHRCLKAGGCFVMAEPVWTSRQGKLEKYLMKKDRGQNIREEKAYLGLLSKYFPRTESAVRSGMLNIPWTLSITKSFS